MIIDTCPVAKETLSTILGDSYELLCVSTDREGLDALSEMVNLIFLDLSVSGIDSAVLIRRIKETHPSIPVIATTAHGTEEKCLSAFMAGARFYLKKPLNAEEVFRAVELLSTVENTVHNRRHLSLPTKGNESLHGEIDPDKREGVLAVMEFICRNYKEPLGLAEACRLASLSKTYFSYFFKRVAGCSLKSYHNKIRIQKAEDIIKHQGVSVKKAAELVGYNDSNYFSALFKKETGLSPKQFQLTCKLLEKNKEDLEEN
ncbi:MAG: DNA-binding response regulator [Nitrospirota bacterium]